MDIELAIDMLEMAQHIDHAVLFSGDGDFRRLVEAVQRRGVRVSVVSTIRSSPPMVVRRSAPPGRQLYRIAGAGAEHHARPSPARRMRRGRAPSRSRPSERMARRRTSPDLPSRDCPLCPRLAAFRDGAARGASRLVQRAGAVLRRRRRRAADRRSRAGLRGANRTGRPFTGDYAGDLLYARLLKFGFAAGSYAAHPRRRARACAAPASPTRCAACRRRTSRRPAEIAACRPFLAAELAALAAAARDPRARRDRPSTRCSPPGAAPRALPVRARRAARAARRHCCSPTAITARGSTRTPAG